MQRTPVADIFDPPFIPPHENALVINALLTFVPWIGRYYARIEQLRIDEADLAALRALRGTRAILAVNHPSREDPIVLFWLSRLLNERFNYLAAREAMVGLNRWVMTRAGAYSILPGVCGTDSIRTTSRLLAEQHRKIVIFPEGDIDDCDPALLPFHSGAAQLGFWALEALKRAGQPLALPVIPLALKYDYAADTPARMAVALTQLERTMRLPVNPASLPQQRLAHIHERIVSRLEASERLRPSPGASLADRVRAIRTSILQRVAGFLNVTLEAKGPANEDSPLQRQQLAQQLMRWTGLRGERGRYLERLHDHRVELALILNQDLQRLQNLEATLPATLNSELSLDRFVAILERFELEVHGRVSLKPRRQAVLRVGELVRLEEFYDQYSANRYEASRAVTARIERNVRAKLQPALTPTAVPVPPVAQTLTTRPQIQPAADRTV